MTQEITFPNATITIKIEPDDMVVQDWHEDLTSRKFSLILLGRNFIINNLKIPGINPGEVIDLKRVKVEQIRLVGRLLPVLDGQNVVMFSVEQPADAPVIVQETTAG